MEEKQRITVVCTRCKDTMRWYPARPILPQCRSCKGRVEVKEAPVKEPLEVELREAG